MCIFYVKTSSRVKPIGRMHMTPTQATKAAARAAKRLGASCTVEHWKTGLLLTVAVDGAIQKKAA